jgi:hypothetical protein
MPRVDFNEIPSPAIADGTQDTFEMFAREFLELTGYRIVSGPDRGADQGRDLIAEEIRTGVGGTYLQLVSLPSEQLFSKFIRTLIRQPAKGGRITKSNLLIHVSYLSLKSLLVYLLAA